MRHVRARPNAAAIADLKFAGKYYRGRLDKILLGDKYLRLSRIKSKYDPNMVFWETPGINADHMQSINGRACLVLPPPLTPSALAPPSDRVVTADLAVDGQFLFGSLELIGVEYPAPGT